MAVDERRLWLKRLRTKSLTNEVKHAHVGWSVAEGEESEEEKEEAEGGIVGGIS